MNIDIDERAISDYCGCEGIKNSVILEEVGFIPGTTIISISGTGQWRPGIFIGYKIGPVDDYRFHTGENICKEIAPLSGNEKSIGTIDDVYGRIDSDWMRKKGLIE